MRKEMNDQRDGDGEREAAENKHGTADLFA